MRKVYRFSIWIRLVCCVFGFGFAGLFFLMFSRIEASNYTQFLVSSFFLGVGICGLLFDFSIITDNRGITKKWFSITLRNFTWEQIKNIRTFLSLLYPIKIWCVTVLCTERLWSKKDEWPRPGIPFINSPRHSISFSPNYEYYVDLLKEITERDCEEGIDRTTRDILGGGMKQLRVSLNVVLAKVLIIVCLVVFLVLFYFVLKP